MKLAAILTVGAALTLGACAVDSQMRYVSYLPDSLKQANPAAAVEAPPDVLAILRANINDVFVSTSAPTNIQYTVPVPAKHGWDTCVKASVTGATGKPLGERTYLVNIENNQIGDRRDAADRCANETYRPLQQHDEIASR
jgi:hypothetical protein